MILCSKCGAKNLDQSQFCDVCGAPIASAKSTANPNQELLPIGIPLPGAQETFASRVRRYLGLDRITNGVPKNKQAGPSPFVRNRDGSTASVPLLRSFRFVHEPIGTSSATRFIGRQNEMESLAERILFS